MLKTIVDVSPELTNFVADLDLPLCRPQKHHVTQVADRLVTVEGSKTLSALYRHFVGDPCPRATADTFREAPRTADNMRVCIHENLAPNYTPG